MKIKFSNGVKIKNKLVVFFSCIALIFLAGSFSANAAGDRGPGEGCGQDDKGICYSGSFSCPDGSSWWTGGEDCMSGYRCCKDDASGSSSGGVKTGADDPNSGSSVKTGADDPAATGGSSVQPLGKIDIPENLGLPNNDILGVLTNVLTWLLGIIGILGLMAFVISGIQYLLASSNEELAETAKKNMTYSILGIVVALSGFVIIQAINLALQGTGWF